MNDKIDNTIKHAADRFDTSSTTTFELDQLGDHFARRELVPGTQDGEPDGEGNSPV